MGCADTGALGGSAPCGGQRVEGRAAWRRQASGARARLSVSPREIVSLRGAATCGGARAPGGPRDDTRPRVPRHFVALQTRRARQGLDARTLHPCGIASIRRPATPGPDRWCGAPVDDPQRVGARGGCARITARARRWNPSISLALHILSLTHPLDTARRELSNSVERSFCCSRKTDFLTTRTLYIVLAALEIALHVVLEADSG